MAKKLKASSQHKLEKRAVHKSANDAIKVNRKILKKEHAKPPESRRTISKLDKDQFPLPKKPGR